MGCSSTRADAVAQKRNKVVVNGLGRTVAVPDTSGMSNVGELKELIAERKKVRMNDLSGTTAISDTSGMSNVGELKESIAERNKVVVNSLGGTLAILDTSGMSNVAELKKSIAASTGIPVCEQRLLLNGSKISSGSSVPCGEISLLRVAPPPKQKVNPIVHGDTLDLPRSKADQQYIFGTLSLHC